MSDTKPEVRKINTIGQGGTYYLTIPRWMVEKLRWRKGQKVEVMLDKGRLTIKDWEEN